MATQPPVTEEVVEEEPSEPLKYKTWALKVSVHCEGCKRKVKRILLGIEGVYTVEVDTKLHKATVTGNVDPGTLIKKLQKSGKQAELWPEKTEQKESKRSKKKNKQNEQDVPENNDNDDSHPAEPENPGSNKGEAAGPPSKVVEIVNSAKPGGNVQFKEVRVELKQPEGQPPCDNPQAPENQPPEGTAPTNGGNAGGGGGGGKKKKKRGKGNGGNVNGNSNGGDPASNVNINGNGEDGAPPQQQPPPQGQGPPPGYRSPPRSYHVYDNPPPPYYAPPPVAAPVYAVSYNTAYPSSSYTASYHASPAPYSYAYVHQGSDSAEGGASPSDTFEMFSDENPNACAVM